MEYSQALMIVNKNFIIIDTNYFSSERLLGYTKEELLGQHVNTLVPPHLRESHNNYLRSVPGDKKNPMVLREVPVISKSGTIHKKLLSANLYKEEYIVVLSDYHEIEKYSLYERLLMQVQDVSWICDINRSSRKIQMIYMSPSCEKMYEIPHEKCMEDVSAIFECITPRSNKRLMDEIDKSVSTGSNGHCLGNFIAPKTDITKKQRWSWTTEPINGKVRCYGTTTDITKEFEIATSKASLEVAETANRQKKNFLERTCHEQRNLHMGVAGGAEVAIDYVEKLEGIIKNTTREVTKLKEVLNIISDSSEHINHLLDTTLSLQQMESEHFTYNYDFYSIHKTVDSCTRQLSHMIKSSVINLNIYIDTGLNTLLIRYDNTKLIQAIMNYLSNAYKYTELGTIKLDVILKDKKDDSLIIELRVEDSGIGISEEHTNDIFKLYKQVNTSYGGSGVGLHLVKKYIEDGHQGSVGFISKKGKGSTFWFIINCQCKTKEIYSRNTSRAFQSTLKIEYKDILLVEDIHSNRLLIGTMLMNLGYQYDECKDGVEALDALKDLKYGIILTDRKMPNMDGIELTKEIIKYYPHQIIIGITGNSIKEQIDEWKSLGVIDIITKPCSKIKLREVLDKFIHPICESGSGV